MRRSTPDEVSTIQEDFAALAGSTSPEAGRHELNRLVSLWEKKGYQLTPYFEGRLYLTWTTFSFPPRFHAIATTPEELIYSPSELIRKASAAESIAA
jgi:hypothetical protein